MASRMPITARITTCSKAYELTGFPEKVFLRGHLIVDGDHWLGHAGMGRFLYRVPGAEVL